MKVVVVNRVSLGVLVITMRTFYGLICVDEQRMTVKIRLRMSVTLLHDKCMHRFWAILFNVYPGPIVLHKYQITSLPLLDLNELVMHVTEWVATHNFLISIYMGYLTFYCSRSFCRYSAQLSQNCH